MVIWDPFEETYGLCKAMNCIKFMEHELSLGKHHVMLGNYDVIIWRFCQELLFC